MISRYTRRMPVLVSCRQAQLPWVLGLAVALVLAVAPSVPYTHATSADFITRAGSTLLLDGRPFRFAGANIYWLGLDSHEGGLTYPSRFRIDDALATAQGMGARVARVHTLGISVGCPLCIEPALGRFNEAALRHNDYVLAEARRYGLRLIIPLTDNWRYYHGGKHTFTDWRELPDENAFYSNPQVIADYERYIGHILNHVNTITGVAYKNDPTIMAWETGNELRAPLPWVKRIAGFIKGIDPRHLVMDGNYGVNPADAGLADVDIVSDHYYPPDVSLLRQDAAAAARMGKVYIAGEFDWQGQNGGDSLAAFLSAARATRAVSGDLYWSLMSHGDQSGFVGGADAYGLTFPGGTVDARARVAALIAHAVAMAAPGSHGGAPPVNQIPATPLVTGVAAGAVAWRGAALAARYSVERATQGPGGPWTVVCNRCATDNDTPWTDPSQPTGALWYRVRGVSLYGRPGLYSPPFGTRVSADRQRIDYLTDWRKSYSHTAHLRFDTADGGLVGGAKSVVMRTKATREAIVWRQPRLIAFQAVAYYWPAEPVVPLAISTSADGVRWHDTKPTITGGQGVWRRYVFTVPHLSGVSYVRVRWTNTDEAAWSPRLSEVVLTYHA